MLPGVLDRERDLGVRCLGTEGFGKGSLLLRYYNGSPSFIFDSDILSSAYLRVDPLEGRN